jgi:hypothetical protein
VTKVYVDEAAILGDSHGARAFSEDALRSLGLLRESGHDVVLVGDPGGPPSEAGPKGDWSRLPTGSVPARPDQPAWYLTTDADRCQGRSAHLRTVLVGSTPEPAAIHRCDALARDVPAAVLEILAAEAMRPDETGQP